MKYFLSALVLLGLGGMAMPARKVQADEGMWLLNTPPRTLLKKKHNFELTDAWLEHAQKSSIRFNNGGSGSFVSAQGLIVTNHHIGADTLVKLSRKNRDLLKEGFLAKTHTEELKCPDLELNVLVEIEDVTEKVNAAAKPEMKPEQAGAARRAIQAKLEQESLDKTGLRSDVVTLYHGALYHLYRYKKYTDIRLVFAPEAAIASFGGDVDNFEFPRWNLDVCFFRAYEKGKQAQVEHFLKWSATGPKEGDLVFVTGHPGTTNRLETLAKLVHRRDDFHPYSLARLRAMEAALHQFGETSPLNAARSASDHHRYANARKAFSGQYQGLLDAAILKRKAEEETALRRAYEKPGKESELDPWEQIEQAQKKLAEFEKAYLLLERGDGFASELFVIARHLLRMEEELKKPSGTRLREYRDSNLDSLKLQLFSPAPIHDDLEKAKLAASLTFLAENLGGTHPIVQRVLDGKPPTVRAAELVAGSILTTVVGRQRVQVAGMANSKDAMVRLAQAIDAESRQLRKRFESDIEEVERQAYARIAQVRFNLLGKDVAPDATFTLRIAFGVVKSYEAEGTPVQFHTTFAGLFERATAQGRRAPFLLPERWEAGKRKLDLDTPFNFVSTADTIGGNSGSPVLNRAGELVGINFDRNRHGLVRNFVYTEERARHISVHSAGVLEALRKIYSATNLLQELSVQQANPEKK